MNTILTKPNFWLKATAIGLVIALQACGSNDSTDSDSASTTDTSSTTISDSHAVNTDKFFASGLAQAITEESCTLSNGTQSTCYRVVVNGFPSDQTTVGPFCPRNISTTADNAGTWFENGALYDLTGEFVSDLAVFYNDSNWQLFDPATGMVKVTDTQVACEAAANPNVPAEYNNYCVECDINYYGGGISSSYLIPKQPVARSSAGSIANGNVGVSFNGVALEGPAPTDAILSAYTIAAFDDCVGHVNANVGYHYHGANGCSEGTAESDGHGAAFAYALDGYAIHAMLDQSGNEATDLDSCRGHSDTSRGYHYHTTGPGENAFIGCFSGETAQ